VSAKSLEFERYWFEEDFTDATGPSSASLSASPSLADEELVETLFFFFEDPDPDFDFLEEFLVELL
jgi:hypothetical protein